MSNQNISTFIKMNSAFIFISLSSYMLLFTTPQAAHANQSFGIVPSKAKVIVVRNSLTRQKVTLRRGNNNDALTIGVDNSQNIEKSPTIKGAPRVNFKPGENNLVYYYDIDTTNVPPGIYDTTSTFSFFVPTSSSGSSKLTLKFAFPIHITVVEKESDIPIVVDLSKNQDAATFFTVSNVRSLAKFYFNEKEAIISWNIFNQSTSTITQLPYQITLRYPNGLTSGSQDFASLELSPQITKPYQASLSLKQSGLYYLTFQSGDTNTTLSFRVFNSSDISKIILYTAGSILILCSGLLAMSLVLKKRPRL